jgi:hypothetical protein
VGESKNDGRTDRDLPGVFAAGGDDVADEYFEKDLELVKEKGFDKGSIRLPKRSSRL